MRRVQPLSSMVMRRSYIKPTKHINRLKARSYANGRSQIPEPFNEPVCEYKKGTKMRTELESTINRMKSEQLEVPLIINGKEVRTGDKGEMRIPYKHAHKLGTYHKATKQDVQNAIDSALAAREKWAAVDFESRASIFLKIADLISGEYRHTLNAATILGQSKNFFQSEIDAVCELADFIRFNVKFASDIYTMQQPISTKSWWNKMEYRPLEGFVYAASPFNFTAIGGNLALSPALMGNVVLWKPSDYSIFSNYQIMRICQQAGLPDGVVNFVPGDPQLITDVALSSPHFSALHYTGSTAVMKSLWKQIGNNLDTYKNYPRIVGETGGKDFIFAHKSAHVDALVTAMIRGAFEFCGQKCSAASRAYIPSSLWPRVKETLLAHMKQVKMGSPEEDENLVNAVIHKGSFQRIKSYIEFARESKEHEILFGGKCDDSVGYFVEPTVVKTTNPKSKLMMEEIFGPVLTIYVYEDAGTFIAVDQFSINKDVATAVKLCDDHPYGLTGAIFAQDRYAIDELSKAFVNSAGNFYINDKPTGAIVGQQPFGGSRLSGTNDKAGCYLNLLRWCSPRTIKETHNPPTYFAYS